MFKTFIFLNRGKVGLIKEKNCLLKGVLDIELFRFEDFVVFLKFSA